jgi:hypothetical protein
MAEVKGVLVTAIRAFLLDRYGKSAVESGIAALDPTEAALIQRPFLGSSFYPYATMVALGNLTRILGTTKRTSGQELGKHIADYVFTGPYKPLLAQDATLMVKKISWLKEFFYRDTNTIESAMNGPASGVVVYRYHDTNPPTRGVCRSLGAFWGRALELAGGVTITGTHPNCVAEGADRCEFKYTW